MKEPYNRARLLELKQIQKIRKSNIHEVPFKRTYRNNQLFMKNEKQYA